jgi:hypothetical protein
MHCFLADACCWRVGLLPTCRVSGVLAGAARFRDAGSMELLVLERVENGGKITHLGVLQLPGGPGFFFWGGGGGGGS